MVFHAMALHPSSRTTSFALRMTRLKTSGPSPSRRALNSFRVTIFARAFDYSRPPVPSFKNEERMERHRCSDFDQPSDLLTLRARAVTSCESRVVCVGRPQSEWGVLRVGRPLPRVFGFLICSHSRNTVWYRNYPLEVFSSK